MNFLTVIEPKIRVVSQFSEDWMMLVLIVILGLIGFVRWRSAKSFNDLFTSLVNVNTLREIMRKELVITSAASQILLVSSILSLTLFFYLLFEIVEFPFFLELDGFLKYMVFVALVSAIYGVKFIFLKAVQYLYKGEFTLNEYLFNVNLFLKLTGLVLMPIIVLLAYSSSLDLKIIYSIGLFLIVISMLTRYARGILSAFQNGISVFYIILYLCTFEILPVVSIVSYVN